MVLPIVGLDIGAISSGNSALLRFGARRIKPSFSSYYLTLSKSQAAVPADGILFPHHRQYLPVSRHFIKDPTNTLSMKFLTQTLALAILISSTTSCQTTNSKDKIIFDKNNCYDEKLALLKKTRLYNEVMSAFRDTFPILKTNKEYFGAPEVVTNQIDDAIFFKKDSSECMLIVLIKSNHPELVFATARTVRGSLKDNKWQFDVSMKFYFEKSYFELFKENSFENISKLARYNVLTDVNVKRKGCEIDDEYWFVHLKN